jgi:hypothetical protein
MVEQEVKWMKKKLKLNPDQIDRVTDISTKYALAQTDFMQKQMRSRARNSSEDGRPSEKDMQKNREIMEKLMKDKDHEMSEVLTAAQYEKYLKRREDMRNLLNKINKAVEDLMDLRRRWLLKRWWVF